MPVVLIVAAQLGACSIPTRSEDSPSTTPAVSDSSSARLAEIEQAEQIRAALAAEVEANARSEAAAAAERLGRIQGVLSSTGTLSPPTAEPGTTSEQATIDRVVDGDTVVTSSGLTVRIIGIDAPEMGACGTDEAEALLRDLVEGQDVTLVNPTSVDDADKYGRILRYVDTGAGDDAAVELLEAGYAVARYDYLDGYDWHPRQDAYRALDDATTHVCGDAAENDPAHILAIAEPEPEPAPAPAGLADVPAAPTEPWNLPGPDLDCKDIGHRVTITGPDYHRLDADGDGIGCESWG
jgi:endonuclease YncB( thermonuclease family)